jgi:hypothetical protein
MGLNSAFDTAFTMLEAVSRLENYYSKYNSPETELKSI